MSRPPSHPARRVAQAPRRLSGASRPTGQAGTGARACRMVVSRDRPRLLSCAFARPNRTAPGQQVHVPCADARAPSPSTRIVWPSSARPLAGGRAPLEGPPSRADHPANHGSSSTAPPTHSLREHAAVAHLPRAPRSAGVGRCPIAGTSAPCLRSAPQAVPAGGSRRAAGHAAWRWLDQCRRAVSGCAERAAPRPGPATPSVRRPTRRSARPFQIGDRRGEETGGLAAGDHPVVEGERQRQRAVRDDRAGDHHGARGDAPGGEDRDLGRHHDR
jgi:hypothetical protein